MRQARGLRRARLVALVLCVAAAALSAALQLTEGFTNLICEFDPDELERDLSGMPPCKEPFFDAETFAIASAGALLIALVLTVVIRRRRVEDEGLPE